MSLFISRRSAACILFPLIFTLAVRARAQVGADSLRSAFAATFLTAMTGTILEGISDANGFSIPCFGAVHFADGNWKAGTAFLGTELGLLLFRKQLLDAAGPSGPGYPFTDNNLLYRRDGGYSPKSDSYLVTAHATDWLLEDIGFMDLFSSFRDLHDRTSTIDKVNMDQTSVPSLMLSPFKPKYLTDPWVLAPVFVGCAANYFYNKNSKPLSSARNVTMFDRTMTPVQAMLLMGGVGALQTIFVAAGEEMMFRGVVQTEATELSTPAVGLVVSSVLFGLWHVPRGNPAYGLSAAIGGLYMGWRYQENGYNLGETIAMHFWNDFLANLIVMVRNPRTAEYVYSINWKF